MKNIARILMLMLFATLVLNVSVLAKSKYSTETIQGTYAWRCTGNATPFGGSFGPAVAQGTVTSDAQGNFEGAGTVSLAGTIGEWGITGPATVNPDGTGSITYAVSIDGFHAFDWHINFLILNEGDEIWGMPYDAGSGVLCTLKRMGEAKVGKNDN
jgi:hypothetical protein